MTHVSAFQSLSSPTDAMGNPASGFSRYPACPLGARPLAEGNRPITWEELLGQR